jgi:hypothetical protein
MFGVGGDCARAVAACSTGKVGLAIGVVSCLSAVTALCTLAAG